MNEKAMSNVTENKGYLINTDFSKRIAEEMHGMEMELPKIKIPSGGGLAYEVPGDDAGSPDMVKQFEAVILYHFPANVYYRDKYTGDNSKPECVSSDGITGTNLETGEVEWCKDCPLNKFGSGEGGNGKACQNKHTLYLLREGDFLPIILTLPTTSLKTFRSYLSSLLLKGRTTDRVVTNFSLAKEKNANGIEYSQAVFKNARLLTEEEIKSVSELARSVKDKKEAY